MVLLPWWYNVDKVTWPALYAASLMFTLTGQQIPHGVTQLNDKSSSVCQQMVVNMNCQQQAYLSHGTALWHWASSNDNIGVIIHSYVMFLSKYASSKLAPHWCLRGADMLCLFFNTYFVVLLQRHYPSSILSPMLSFANTVFTGLVFISALLMRSGQNILMEEVWNDVFLKSSATLSGATQHLCDTKTFTACPCQILLFFLTINIAAKAYINALM